MRILTLRTVFVFVDLTLLELVHWSKPERELVAPIMQKFKAVSGEV